jgi:hypothetical protein
LEQGLATQPDEVVPYKILPMALNSVKPVVASLLVLFNGNWSLVRGVGSLLLNDSATNGNSQQATQRELSGVPLGTISVRHYRKNN